MSWPAYQDYDDPDVEWLGQVPVTWKVGALKRWIDRIESGTSVNAADVPANENEIGVLKTSCVYTGQFDINENKTVLAEDLERVACPVKEGTLIVSRMNTPDLVGATGYVTHTRTGIYLPDRLWQITFRNLSAKWVGYWSRTKAYRDQLKATSVGTSSSMQNISQGDFGSLSLAVPPNEDQQAIVRFLDRETAKIDALIAKQEQLIATLREDRTATITHAVTKGLDPDVEMKDSGVEWLGNIPTEWTVQRMSWLFSLISSGTTPDSGNPNYYGGDVNWVTTGELREGPIIGTSKAVTEQALIDHSALKVYPPGSLLIAMYGATIGRLGILEVPACTNQACCVFSDPRQGMETRFAYYALWAARDHLLVAASGGGQPNINQEKLRSLRIAIPNRLTQRKIVQYLDHSLDKIDALTAKAGQVIDTLREYRSALVTDAVTGKIDLRGVA